jgi:hypothetical protein
MQVKPITSIPPRFGEVANSLHAAVSIPVFPKAGRQEKLRDKTDTCFTFFSLARIPMRSLITAIRSADFSLDRAHAHGLAAFFTNQSAPRRTLRKE